MNQQFHDAARMDEYHCTCCGRLLDPNKLVWLDLNARTLEYRSESWPEGESQGRFPFGIACAKRVLKAKGKCDYRSKKTFKR